MTASDSLRLAFDGTVVEGSIAGVDVELTMTAFTAPTIEDVVEAYLRASTRAPLALEMNPDDLRVWLGSLLPIFRELYCIPLGTGVLFDDVEIRSSVYVARGSVRAVYSCARCTGAGELREGERAVGSVWLAGQRCPSCDGLGETRHP